MKTYKIRVTWWNSTDIEVTAKSEDEALAIAERDFEIFDALEDTKSYDYVVDFELNEF
jgi:hypothetical protein